MRFIPTMNNSQEDVYICPSFNSYSSDKLAEIAVRVAGDMSSDAASDDDFEFAFVREGMVEEFFYDGQIQPVFPVFNRDLLKIDGESAASGGGDRLPESESSVVISLSQLFSEEDSVRDYPPSCSSSDADDLEEIPAGEYCVWRPKMAEPQLPSQCNKSRSTGSGSKRWKIRDLLRRSKSDGKESFVFLTPKHRIERPEKLIQASKRAEGKGLQLAAAAAATGAPPYEAFYVRNRAMKEGDKKKSYLPYRQDLVGFFANANGVRRSLPH